MTKRLPKKAESPFKRLHSAPIHVVGREMTEDTNLALTEQLFEMQPSTDDIAKLIVSKLDKNCTAAATSREGRRSPRTLNRPGFVGGHLV
jgi:hypothetical protein